MSKSQSPRFEIKLSDTGKYWSIYNDKYNMWDCSYTFLGARFIAWKMKRRIRRIEKHKSKIYHIEY